MLNPLLLLSPSSSFAVAIKLILWRLSINRQLLSFPRRPRVMFPSSGHFCKVMVIFKKMFFFDCHTVFYSPDQRCNCLRCLATIVELARTGWLHTVFVLKFAFFYLTVFGILLFLYQMVQTSSRKKILVCDLNLQGQSYKLFMKLLWWGSTG